MEEDFGDDYQEDYRRCKNCRFFAPIMYEFDDTELPSDFGECRRFPPKPVPAEEQGFPVVEEDNWCGEFGC